MIYLKRYAVSALLIFVLSFSFTADAEQTRHQEFPTYFAHVNGLSIAYQDFGNADNPTILLVMGLGAQLIHWSDTFVQSLVNSGFRVIRFDNRDIGLSEKLFDLSTPGITTLIRYKLGLSLGSPYKLEDMAKDGIELLDHLEIQQAHVVGVSMGGMIGQIMAAKYPERVNSLASIMSTSGAAHLPEGNLTADQLERKGATREELIKEGVRIIKAIYARPGGPGEAEWYRRSARTYDRNYYPDGQARQFWAIMDSGDRIDLLRSIQQPTVVIHGKIDPLIPLVHGEHTAELVPDAELLLIDDMGHFIAKEHEEKIKSALLSNILRTQR